MADQSAERWLQCKVVPKHWTKVDLVTPLGCPCLEVLLQVCSNIMLPLACNICKRIRNYCSCPNFIPYWHRVVVFELVTILPFSFSAVLQLGPFLQRGWELPRRFFILDFDKRIFYYTHTESRQAQARESMGGCSSWDLCCAGFELCSSSHAGSHNLINSGFAWFCKRSLWCNM